MVCKRIFFLHLPDLFQPLRILLGFQHRQQPFQDFLHIADHTSVHQNILINFSRIHIDLKDFRLTCEGLGIAHISVGKTGAQNDQQVAFIHAKIRGFCSVHSQHTRVERIITRKCTLSHQRVTDRRLKLMRQLPHLFGRTGNHRAAAHEQIGLLRLIDHIRRCRKSLFGNRLRHRKNFFRLLISIFAGGRSDILGHVHQDGTRPSAFGDFKSTAQSIRQFINIFYDNAVFRNGHGYARDINFLEAVLSQQRFSHIGSNRHQRD